MEKEGWAGRFFTVWTGQSVSLMGSQLVQFALIWWLTVETGSATILTVASVMGILPQVLLAPFAGALVDRWRRRRVIIMADGLMALLTLGLMALFALGSVNVILVLAALLLRSVLSGFHWPAMRASTSLMVPQPHLARINGLNESVRGLASIAAPPLGAVLIATLPMSTVLSVDVITAAIAISALLVVRIPEVRRGALRTGSSISTEIRDAWRHLSSWRGALTLMLVFMLINFMINPAFALLPLLTVQHFGGGAMQYAALESAAGVGMILGGLVLGVWGGTTRKVVTCMAATGLCGVGVLTIGLLPADGYVMAVAGCLLIGLTLPVINGTMVAIMQKGIRADMQGRVLSMLGAGVMAMSPVGLLLAGPISDTVGVQIWFIGGGVLMLLTAVGSTFMPVMARMEDRETEDVQLDPSP